MAHKGLFKVKKIPKKNIAWRGGDEASTGNTRQNTNDTVEYKHIDVNEITLADNIFHKDDTNTVFQLTSDQFNFVTGGSTRWTINNNGVTLSNGDFDGGSGDITTTGNITGGSITTSGLGTFKGVDIVETTAGKPARCTFTGILGGKATLQYNNISNFTIALPAIQGTLMSLSGTQSLLGIKTFLTETTFSRLSNNTIGGAESGGNAIFTQGSSGDAFVLFKVPAETWRIGIDNSDADSFGLWSDVSSTVPVIKWSAAGLQEGQRSNIVFKTAAYTATTSDYTILCSGAFTVKLPALSSNIGRIFHIKNVGGGSIIVSGATIADKIDHGDTATLSSSLGSIKIHGDNANNNWWIL